ncbi:MAG: GDSL-type esterase/lipase family protein [Flavobacteriaceae bacterium]|nr:GDSL-type esterase/lipase family protein [Flavobacteriaceae bacterium]
MTHFQIFKLFFLFIGFSAYSQHIENAESLQNFTKKLNENQSVSNVLFLGDSHIQSGWISEVLRKKFQEKYGNAGRGLVFPYSIANSNSPQDFLSVSNRAWKTFRSVYEQDIFPEIGALGFVMGNSEDSFIEIYFKNPEDEFNEVKIFNDKDMIGENFTIYESDVSLSDDVKKTKKMLDYTVEEGETYPELAAKFNVVTTRLLQLNGESVKNPKAGQKIKAEQIIPEYNTDFENKIAIIGTGKYENGETVFHYPKFTQRFLMKTNASKGNIFYGFQFLKNSTNGVVFNSIGINGATYSDFLKYPLQIKELADTNPDLLMISLGTNESLSSITKDEFQKNVENLIESFRNYNPNLPILLVSPTDNNQKPEKVKEIVSWIREVAILNHAAFLNQYEATGGKGYFRKSLNKKTANADGVHFLKDGYEQQANLIWKMLSGCGF